MFKIITFILMVGLWGSPCVSQEKGATPLAPVERAKKALVSVKKSISLAAYRNPDVVYRGGFVCDKKRGWIVTIIGVQDAGPTVATYEITLPGGQKVGAKSLYRDPLLPIEILVFDPQKVFEPLEEISDFADQMSLSEEVTLLSKHGAKEVVQGGSIASLYETGGILTFQAFRVSLSTPGGTDGGVVIAKDGTCVGLVCDSGQTFSRVLHVDYLKDVCVALKARKKPARVFIKGVDIISASLVDAVRYTHFPEKELQTFLAHYPQALAQGLIVHQAMPESPLKAGDVIWAVNGILVGPSLATCQRMMAAHTIKKPLSLTVFRSGKKINVDVMLDDAWSYVIEKMVLFGGALFYETDLLCYALYNIPFGSLMVSKVTPGSVFDRVFPSFPVNGPAVSFARIHAMDRQKMQRLDDLIRVIPSVAVQPYFAVRYQDYGCGVTPGNLLKVDRSLSITYIDFLASTSIPEVLSWSQKTLSWQTEPIALPDQKCLIQQ
ncbi:S1C family serine protease [Candidatus Hepatobacter penaei]|uniref:S1C family serine protease n=1 Tax=Candidatus Hepatobacter penaei TaxID=1274402 RepID=UPI00155B0AF3|nr:S1C family serine protease [Candidatus Hepatobacter penaei]